MSNAYVDHWDMLINFCFHVYAQKSLFIAENCNAFLTSSSSSSPLNISVHRAGSQLKMGQYQKNGKFQHNQKFGQNRKIWAKTGQYWNFAACLFYAGYYLNFRVFVFYNKSPFTVTVLSSIHCRSNTSRLSHCSCNTRLSHCKESVWLHQCRCGSVYVEPMYSPGHQPIHVDTTIYQSVLSATR